MSAGPGFLPTGLGAGMPQKSSAGARGRSVRLQFLMDVAHATFNQPCAPTMQQIDALRQTLNQVPLEELGITQHQQEVESSSSSRSSSPGLSEGTHALLQSEHERELPNTGSLVRSPRPPITYLLIYEDSRVSLGIFCLPARAKIPLHNHPGMTVLSRLLSVPPPECVVTAEVGLLMGLRGCCGGASRCLLCPPVVPMLAEGLGSPMTTLWMELPEEFEERLGRGITPR